MNLLYKIWYQKEMKFISKNLNNYIIDIEEEHLLQEIKAKKTY